MARETPAARVSVPHGRQDPAAGCPWAHLQGCRRGGQVGRQHPAGLGCEGCSAGEDAAATGPSGWGHSSPGGPAWCCSAARAHAASATRTAGLGRQQDKPGHPPASAGPTQRPASGSLFRNLERGGWPCRGRLVGERALPSATVSCLRGEGPGESHTGASGVSGGTGWVRGTLGPSCGVILRPGCFSG